MRPLHCYSDSNRSSRTKPKAGLSPATSIQRSRCVELLGQSTRLGVEPSSRPTNLRRALPICYRWHEGERQFTDIPRSIQRVGIEPTHPAFQTGALPNELPPGFGAVIVAPPATRQQDVSRSICKTPLAGKARQKDSNLHLQGTRPGATSVIRWRMSSFPLTYSGLARLPSNFIPWI